MDSLAFVVEKLRPTECNIKLLIPHTITNQQHIFLSSSISADSLFINSLSK